MTAGTEKYPEWMFAEHDGAERPQFITLHEIDMYHQLHEQDATPKEEEPKDEEDRELTLLENSRQADPKQGEDEFEDEFEDVFEDDVDIKLPDGADGDRADDPDYVDDAQNYISDYEYPADVDDDYDEEDRDNEDDDDDEEEEEPASVIESDEEAESDIESLLSDQGEEEVGDSINVGDGLGTSAQAQACRQNIGTFRRSQENSSSIFTAMVDRHERDGQLTVGLRERQIRGRDRYFDAEDNGLEEGFVPLETGVDVDERGRKIPAHQIMEPYMFQNVKTLRSWKRPEHYTMADVVTWSKQLPDPDDWHYSAFKNYTTGKIEYVQNEEVMRDGKRKRLVVGYTDGALKRLNKK